VSRLLPRNQALDDQIVAALRAEAFPHRTHEVAGLLGSRAICHGSEHANCDGCDRPDCHPGRFLNFHPGPVMRAYTGPDVRRNLERLARQGRIEKLRLDGSSWVYWRG
jgi:hypothetical protein